MPQSSPAPCPGSAWPVLKGTPCSLQASEGNLHERVLGFLSASLHLDSLAGQRDSPGKACQHPGWGQNGEWPGLFL